MYSLVRKRQSISPWKNRQEFPNLHPGSFPLLFLKLFPIRTRVEFGLEVAFEGMKIEIADIAD